MQKTAFYRWVWILLVLVLGWQANGVEAQETTDFYIGHRYYAEKEGGWGWIKLPKEKWNKARWIALKETPPRIVAPWRKRDSQSADHNVEYRIWGKFADYKAYDPHRDEYLDVFILERYEELGAAEPLKRKPGPRERFTTSRRQSGASSRNDRPIVRPEETDGF
jgi:hypothetical protein